MNDALWNAIADLWDSPGGKLLATIMAAVFSALGLWGRQWRAERAERRHQEDSEEDEERDWELRCLRTEADLERLDSYVQRVSLELKTQLLPLLIATIERLNNNGTDVEGRVLAGKLEYHLIQLEVEITAHEQERPKYLNRLHQTQEVRDSARRNSQQPPPPL